MTASMNFEIEASPPLGSFALNAIAPLPEGVPTPDSIVIPIGVIHQDPARRIAASLMGDSEYIAFLDISRIEEYRDDDEWITPSLADRLITDLLNETVDTYRRLVDAGWYADIRLRYTY